MKLASKQQIKSETNQSPESPTKGFALTDNRPELIAQRKLMNGVAQTHDVDENQEEPISQLQKANGWYVTNKNANLRQNDTNHTAYSDKVPQGTKVQIADKGNLISNFKAGWVTNEHSWVGTANKRIGWIEDSKLDSSTRDYTSLGGDDLQAKLRIADAAIAFAQSKITHGPANQTWARDKYGDEGAHNMDAMIALTNAQWGPSGGYNANWTDPSKIGASVEATGGGNCQDIAALTFQYLREHCDPSWTICFVVNDTVKHSFATIGIPNTDDHSTVVVADAWVQFPKAVTLQNHFCNGGTITVHQQAGKKSEGAETQMSTLWDATQLPGYVEALKQQSRQRGAGPASWNNNFPEGG